MTDAPFAVKRLIKRREFLHAAKGKKAVRPGVVIQAHRRDGNFYCGVGFTATKKIGNAVTRNRAKRRLREAARLLLPLHGRLGFDYVFIARHGTPDREWTTLMSDIKYALMSLAPDGDEGTIAAKA
jgi:ribonuclease P protein component